jgi:uncharacterized protein YuzE
VSAAVAARTGVYGNAVKTVTGEASQNYINNPIASSTTTMKLTYSERVDAAYLYLAGEDALAARTYPCDPAQAGAMINLDFDANGRLIGIEVLDASKVLPADMLATARRIGSVPEATIEDDG